LDYQGIDPGTTLTKLVGGMVIVDPLFRMFIAGKSNKLANVPLPMAAGTVNMTISGNSLYKMDPATGESSFLGTIPTSKLCTSVQQVLNTYFDPLQPASAYQVTWMWFNSAFQVFPTELYFYVKCDSIFEWF
jgi:hypothetical protein